MPRRFIGMPRAGLGRRRPSRCHGGGDAPAPHSPVGLRCWRTSRRRPRHPPPPGEDEPMQPLACVDGPNPVPRSAGRSLGNWGGFARVVGFGMRFATALARVI
jgi:hypothetical protein